MSFGIFASTDATALLMSDTFTPYYYRGGRSWNDIHLFPRGTSWAEVSYPERELHRWTLDAVVYHEGGAWSVNGYYIFPKFADTDLVFIEPLSGMVWFAVNSLTTVNDGLSWKLDFNVGNDKAIYDWMGSWASDWPDANAGYNAVCPLLPKVHVFSQLSASGVLNDRFGVVIRDKNGAEKYNSSQRPLRIRDIVNVTYPSPTANVMSRLPTEKSYFQHVYCERPMYCISTVTQAVSQFWWSDSVTRKTYLGDLGPSVTTSWQYQIWGVYGGALTGGGKTGVGATWACLGSGKQTSSSTSGSFFFGLIPTGSSQKSNGSPPYTHINCNSTNMPCLVADAADYI